MPTYNFKCATHGIFEEVMKISDLEWTKNKSPCPTCGDWCNQVIITPPMLDTEGMADAGCPGAFETSSDRMTKRHKDADKAGDWASRDSTEFGDSVGEDRLASIRKYQ
jgi:putative FmdB family regulatory protein